MNFDMSAISWPAVGVCFVVGQIVSTVYFTVLFGKPWADAYAPGTTPSEHTKDIPMWTYGVGAACTLALVISLAVLQAALGAQGLGDAMRLGALVSVGFVLATMLPGYAFLRRWNAGVLSVGSQVLLTLIISAILGLWP